MKRVPWRRVIFAASLLFTAWVVWGIVHAGGDTPVRQGNAVSELRVGHAEGRRVDSRAWSLDYDTIVEAPDGSTATLTHVRNGEIFRNGKPYVSIKADTMVVNTLTNDFSAAGHVVLAENDGKHKRNFRSQQALYNGGPQILTLPVQAHIEDDGMAATVDRATVNLRTGEMSLGRINALG